MDYRSFNDEMQEMFGGKVYRLALSIGATCPNRDGRCGTGGCIFCSAGGSGDFAANASLPVTEQIREAKRRVEAKQSRNFAGYMAYFQSFTSTYARNAEEALRQQDAFAETLRQPEVLALSIATRPDCLPDETVRAIADLQEQFQKPVWVELGLQTIHEETAQRIRRGYPLAVFADAYRRLKAESFPVVVHLIFGLPGESREDMLESVRYLATLDPPPDGVKLQMLHLLRGTALGEEYQKGPFPLLSLEEYAELIEESAAILPPETVFHRITGDGPGRLLLAPDWTRNKKRVLNTLNARLAQYEI